MGAPARKVAGGGHREEAKPSAKRKPPDTRTDRVAILGHQDRADRVTKLNTNPNLENNAARLARWRLAGAKGLAI
eukprot:10342415-Lingulodinium_polyedra.AAC.1